MIGPDILGLRPALGLDELGRSIEQRFPTARVNDSILTVLLCIWKAYAICMLFISGESA
jgi:hypothetical protein